MTYAPQPPFPEDPAICRWCGDRRQEVFPAEGALPALYVCNRSCAGTYSSPYLEQCPECRRDFKTGARRASLCYECDQKERAAHQSEDQPEAAKTYNERIGGRGGFRSWW